MNDKANGEPDWQSHRVSRRFSLQCVYYYISKFAQLAQIFQQLKTLGFGYSSRQDAKTLRSEEKDKIP